jgi:hypothetical protein
LPLQSNKTDPHRIIPTPLHPADLRATATPTTESGPQPQDQNEIYLRFLRFKLQKKQKQPNEKDKPKQNRKNKSSARQGPKGTAILLSRNRNCSQAGLTKSKSKL